MARSKTILITLILSGCAPITPSVPKNAGNDCADTQKYNSVNTGDRSYDVETKMGQAPSSETTNGTEMTQVYIGCQQSQFNYDNDQVVSKQVK